MFLAIRTGGSNADLGTSKKVTITSRENIGILLSLSTIDPGFLDDGVLFSESGYARRCLFAGTTTLGPQNAFSFAICARTGCSDRGLPRDLKTFRRVGSFGSTQPLRILRPKIVVVVVFLSWWITRRRRRRTQSVQEFFEKSPGRPRNRG